MNKIRQYFSTLEIIRGFLIALLGSAFIYIEYLNHSIALISTLLGLASLYMLILSNRKTWLFSGFFTGILWFWWTAVSFKHYDMLWAIPIVILLMGLLYAVIFWFIAYISEKISTLLRTYSLPFTIIFKAIGLLILSYIHPFGFDWFKPELMFVNSYIGIEKWQFSLVLTALVLSIWKKQPLFLLITLFAYQTDIDNKNILDKNIKILTTHTDANDKWNEKLHERQFDKIFKSIDNAIENKKTLIILPESIFPVFLSRDRKLMDKLKKRAEKISIVTGALYWDGKTPHNSSYIFTDNKVTIANKVILVPFGESNPLPDFLSNWVNKVFYDGAVDYKADTKVTDYTIDGTTYRNAICFEATSERLYEKEPKQMIVLSNNAWFYPSTEPTLQKLLLQYYSKKYGTTIYHSANMSESYIIKRGKVFPL